MDDWHVITLTKSQVAAGTGTDFVNQFMKIFLALGCPEDMAVFSSTIDCGVVRMYLTPACSYACEPLIQAYAGTSCDKPSGGVIFRAGPDGSFERFSLNRAEI